MKLPSLLLVLLSVETAHGQLTYACSASTDVIFVLDSSQSVEVNQYQINNWDPIRRFVSAVIRNLGETIVRRSYSSGIRFALVQFAENARLTFGFNAYTDHRDAADAVLQARNFGGSTNLAAGLQEAERLLPSRAGSRNVVIVVVSDFRPNIDRSELFIAQRLKLRDDVKIVSVGVQSNINEMLMRQISSENRAIISKDYQQLINYISPLIMVMCADTRPGGSARQCARDIVLSLDTSVSIDTWNTLKEFAALVAANLAMSEINTRIGVVTFSDTGTVISNLVTYSQSLANSITRAPNRQGLTSIAQGLTTANNMLSDQTRQRHVIIFTDGIVTRDYGQEVSIAASMRRAGVNIIAYGIGSPIDRGTLESLVAANQRNSHVIVNPSYATNSISDINSVTSLTACLITTAPCVVRQADVVIAIDASGSIIDKGFDNWRKMQNFATELIRQLNGRYPQIRIGALIFSDRAQQLYPITSNYYEVITAVQRATNQRGYTNQADALRLAGTMLNAVQTIGDQRAHYIIMVTDGEPTMEIGVEETEARVLKRAGVTNILVGVTNSIVLMNLNKIASGNQYVFVTPNFDALNSVPLITNVVRATTNCPGEPARDIPSQCHAADVVFAMDRSGSIEYQGTGNFVRLKNFVSDLARSMHQRYREIRFGLVAFSDDAQIISWLRRYNDIESFVSTVQNVQYLGSQTNLADAISVSLRVLGQGTENGQIILVTDGEATVNKGKEYDEADTARRFGVMLSAVAVTQNFRNYEYVLHRITGNRDRVFPSPNFERLQKEVVSVRRVACEPQGGNFVNCPGLPEIVFVLDVSASINANDLSMAKEFIINAIDTFRRGNSQSRFALVVFSTRARTIFDLQGDMQYIRNMVNSIYTDRMGDTNIAAGLEIAQQVLYPSRSGSTRVVILITDGLANVRTGDELGIANRIKNSGASIVTVGVTAYGPDYNKLQQIASSPNAVIRALNFAMLRSRIAELTQIACRSNNDFIPLPPRPVTPSPFTPRPFTPAPQPVPAPIPDRPTGLPYSCPGSHVVFVIDESRRLYRSQSEFDQTKNLAASILRHISSTKLQTKFAIITFHSWGMVKAGFSPFRSTNELVNVIQGLRLGNSQDSDHSNIAYGMFEGRNILTQNINTRNVQSHIILFSDGVSDLNSGIAFIESRIARSMGIRVMAVALSSSPATNVLIRLTGDSSLVFNAPNNQLNGQVFDTYIDRCGSTQLVYSRQDSHCPEEIVFVIDVGGNQTMEQLEQNNVTNFLSSIVEEYARFYDVRGRFAAIQYGDTAEVSLTFSKDIPYVTYSLRNLKNMNFSEGQPANMATGLNLANRLFEDNEKSKLVIVITDEVADAELTDDILTEVQYLNDREINVNVVGIASNPEDDRFFEEVAGSAGGAISVNKYEELKNEVNNVINAACQAHLTFRQNDEFSLTL